MGSRRAKLAALLITMAVTATTAACSGSDDSDDPLAGMGPPSGSASAPAAAPTSRSAGPAATAQSPAAPAPHTPAGQAIAPATQDPPPPPQDVPRCKTANLSVRVVRQGKAAGGLPYGLIAFTNTTSRACGLSGWPSVDLTSGGQVLSLSSTDVNRPRPPVAVTVEPQRSAFAGVRWRACSPPAAGCRTGNGFRVAAPGSTAVQAELVGFPTTEQKGFAISALVIGTVQPTTTDIINW